MNKLRDMGFCGDLNDGITKVVYGNLRPVQTKVDHVIRDDLANTVAEGFTLKLDEYIQDLLNPEPQVFVNGDCVTCKYNDGQTVTVRCQPDDNFDLEKAIALCYMKRAMGNTGKFNNYIKRLSEKAIWQDNKKRGKSAGKSHFKRSTKVFSIYAWMKDTGYTAKDYKWVHDAEGKVPEVLDTYGYLYTDNWFVPIRQYIPYEGK